MTPSVPEAPDPQGGTATRVLIVDDHDMFAESLRLALSAEAGLEIIGTVATLADARKQVAAARPDVVLLDHRLPDGLGVEAIGELKDLHPEVQVVVLTGAADDAMLVRATELGCAGFILKTSPLDELIEAVRTAAAGEIIISRDLLVRLVERLQQKRDPVRTELTAREREILQLISQGMTNGAMAAELFISVNTVRNHVQSLLTKLNAHSKLEALSIGIRDGLVDPPPTEAG